MTNTQNRDESRGCISVAWKSVRGYGCLYVCLCHPGACRGLEAQHTLQSYTRRPDHGHNRRPDRQNSEYDGPRQQDDESYVFIGRGEIDGVNLDDRMPVPNIQPSNRDPSRSSRILLGDPQEPGQQWNDRGRPRTIGFISVAWKSVRGCGCLYVCLCHPGDCRGRNGMDPERPGAAQATTPIPTASATAPDNRTTRATCAWGGVKLPG